MKKSKTSLLRRILIPFLVVMLFQTVLFYCGVFKTGTMEKLKNNSFHIFSEKVNNRRNSLENDMLTRWGNVESAADDITDRIQEEIESLGKKPEELTFNSKDGDAVLSGICDNVLELLRRNMVTGAFVVLDGDGSDKKSGIYFRDSDPVTITGDDSDLLAIRGPSSITSEYKIALDRFWTPGFYLDREDPDNAYYYKPVDEARKHPKMSGKDLGYWSKPFYLNKSGAGDSTHIITYSVPLLMGGEPVGVAGVEISLDYLNSQLPYRELGTQNYGSYLLAVGDDQEAEQDGLSFHIVTQSGIISKQLFSEQEEQIEMLKDPVNSTFYPLKIQDKENRTVYGCVHPIKLYNTHTPFENEQWVLIGIVSDQHLLSFFYSFRTSIFIMIAAFLAIGLAASCVIAKWVCKPITALSRKLKSLNPAEPIRLERIRVAEIDELSGTIEDLSSEVVDNADKLSTILAMTSVKVGACEYNHKNPHGIFCTGQFCEMLGIAQEGDYVDVEIVKAAIRKMKKYLVSRDKGERVFVFHIDQEEPGCWLRAKVVTKQGGILVVLTDVSRDMEEKLKLEHERDFDILTNLYNRRAFYARMTELFKDPDALLQGAMAMLDLDNLKYVNDTYGHDYGDEYICRAADVLRQYPDQTAVIARLSGDEFMIFVYGYDSQEEIKDRFSHLFARFKDAKLLCPDAETIQVRASAGIAFYPQDADNYQELSRYADFAMYMVKRTNKGRIVEFDVDTYNKESYLLQCREELNKLIEEGMLDYMFQPIVSARDGSIFAYEALMRPRTQNIKTPFELLSLARSQSKLHEIELLTFFKSMECFDKLEISKGCEKLFINSIANQCMDKEEEERFERTYQKYLSRIVLELTEEDRMDVPSWGLKRSGLKRWNAGIAIDDFGTGYNSESVLLNLQPDYVKIDRSLVEEISTDEGKQMLISHLVAYAREHHILTIAEGVETADEMRMLIAEGVDYLQGYYLARPAFVPSKVPEEVRRQILDMRKK